jgi:predicted KAP-like P-loop ATPase
MSNLPTVGTPSLSDHPRTKRAHDLLGVSRSTVPRLARIAVEWPTEEGVVLGLYGRWGSGKTSIFNFLREYIDERREHDDRYRQVYVVEFQPWIYEDHAALVASFFSTVAAEISPSDSSQWKEIGRGLKKMGKFFAAAAGGVSFFGLSVDAAKALKQAGEISQDTADFAELMDRGEVSLREARKEVVAGLEQIGAEGGRVLVVVDDLDRLGPAEMIGMLRLLRIAGDLPCVTLLVALDEQKVRSVLDAAGYTAEYLEKIIPTGLRVPALREDKFIELVIAQLREVLSRLGLEPPEWLSSGTGFLGVSDQLGLILSYVRTPRDLTRYLNALRILLLSSEDDPDLNAEDALFLELIHVFQPEVYDRLREHRAFLTHDEGLRNWLAERRPGYREERIAQVTRIIRGDALSEVAGESRTHELLERLFGDIENSIRPSEIDSAVWASERRIRNPEIFWRYFGLAREESGWTARQVKDFTRELIHRAESADTNAVAEHLAPLASLSKEVRSEVLRDLSQELQGTIASVMASIGGGALVAARQFSPDLAGAIAYVIAHRIAAPRNNWYFDTDERKPALSAFLSQAAEELPLVESGYLIRAAEEYRDMLLLDQARRNWLQRLDVWLQEHPLSAINDADTEEVAVEERLNLLYSGIEHLVALDLGTPTPEFSNVGAAVLGLIREKPGRIVHLLEKAGHAANRWKEPDNRAHIRRLRRTLGSELVDQIANAIETETLEEGDARQIAAAIRSAAAEVDSTKTPSPDDE